MRLPTDRAVTALARLYEAAEAHLRALVAESIASGALGTARYRQQRLALVQQLLAAAQAEAVPEATQLVVDSYTLGGNIAGIEGGFGTGIHTEAVEVLADALVGRLNDAAERVGRQADDIFRREGLRHAALDLIQAGTQRDASKQLQEALIRQGISGFQDRAGRDWGLATYANMVVRTTTREAVSRGTILTLTEQGVDLVTWKATDVADDEPCKGNNDRTFSITGATDGYPILTNPPPAHPNCRCVIGPATANLDALERQLGLASTAVAA